MPRRLTILFGGRLPERRQGIAGQPRNAAALAQKRKPPRKAPEVPICGKPVGKSVDIGVRRHLIACGQLMTECARWLHDAEKGDEAREAQRRLLLNFEWCLAQAVIAMVVLLDHDAQGGVLILERTTIEYYGRASYYMKEPDHAVWTVEVERLGSLIHDEPDPEKRTELIRAMSQARRKHVRLTPEARAAQGLIPFQHVRIADMIRRGLGPEAVRRYRSASLMLHGDLFTSKMMRERPAEAMNAAVLEAASGMIAFSNLMLSWLERAPSGLTERVLEAEEETQRLAKRYGRAFLLDAHPIEAVEIPEEA